MEKEKVIAFFPEAAYGPALNSVGIAQACERIGHRAVFLTADQFPEFIVPMAPPMPAEEMARYWQNFINSHIPNFNKSPFDQIDNYVRDCWDAIVDTAIWAQKDLPQVLDQVRPDLVCVDNVILFPTIKQYGKPWVRIISCTENELPDPAIPPHLSGCGQNDKECFRRFEDHFNQVIRPIHDRFNAFLAEHQEAPYPLGQFFEASPYLNLLLYPEPVRFKRRHALDPRRFQYLEGCVRQEEPYTSPTFKAKQDKPLVYVSFGSLGSGDTATLKRLIGALGGLPMRALVNVGGYFDAYEAVPDNVVVDKSRSVRMKFRFRPSSPGRQSFRCILRMLVLRQTVAHHAIRLGRSRQRHAGARNWPRHQGVVAAVMDHCIHLPDDRWLRKPQ